MMRRHGLIGALIFMGLVGCTGKGERIDIAIPSQHSETNQSNRQPGTLRVAVLSFEDQRTDRSHLGTRTHFWGGTSYFDLPSGTLSEATAQALVDYLTRRGWQAALARTAGQDNADVTIAGTIHDFSIQAVGGFMQTELSAKNMLVLQMTNRSDGSTVRERVQGTGSDRVFWFEPSDAQGLTTELFEKNFERFEADIRTEGRALRLR